MDLIRRTGRIRGYGDFLHYHLLARGCIDLVIDKDGGFHFLEVNQAGQFLFVEEMLPAWPILQAMTAMLVSGRTDYVLDSIEPVSMKAFWRSDRFLQLRDNVSETPPERMLYTVE